MHFCSVHANASALLIHASTCQSLTVFILIIIDWKFYGGIHFPENVVVFFFFCNINIEFSAPLFFLSGKS